MPHSIGECWVRYGNTEYICSSLFLKLCIIEHIHKELVSQRDAGKAVLLVSLELDEVMNLSDRILVMYEGEIVGELDPKKTTVEELGLYMAGAKREGKA